MKTFFALLMLQLLGTYTYSVTMSNPEQAVYMVTNLIASVAWVTLGCLIHMSRTRHSPPMVRTWVYPLAISMKIFAGISAVRYFMNDVVIYLPSAKGIQSWIYVINVLALGFAVGYASIYYKRIPGFLQRLSRHQALSRRFSVIADYAVDGFLEVDSEGNIYYANRAAAEIFGKPDPKELLGENLVDDYMRGETQRYFKIIRDSYRLTQKAEIVGKREPTRLEMQRANSETFAAEITVSEYDVSGQKRFCVLVRDISYRVSLEENQKV